MCILHINMLTILDPILSALARLLVARGETFPALAERLKGHYVQAAIAQVEAQGHKVTDSRLSVLSGLHRRDVARLRNFSQKPARPSPLTRLVTLWSRDPRYAGRALPRTGPEPSFEALAREVIQDVHPRTLLDTLLDAGTCREEGDLLHLQSAAYVPAAGSEAQLAYLAANVGDHLAAATENVLTGADAAQFERALHLSELTAKDVETLRTRFQTGQMALMQEMLETAEQMKTNTKGTHRFRAGAFVFAKDTT